MKKEYPPRSKEEIALSHSSKYLRICECGHFATRHDGIIFIGRCNECQCPKFKYDKEQTIKELSKWT